MIIEKLVPPLELCKLIPDGEFQDSFAKYAEIWCIDDVMPDGTEIETTTEVFINCGFFVVPKKPTPEVIEFVKNNFSRRYKIVKAYYPAPTLEEIMEELPKDNAYNDLLIGYSARVDKFTGWHIYYSGDRKRHTYDQSAVTAALKLWLKTKGIKHD